MTLLTVGLLTINISLISVSDRCPCCACIISWGKRSKCLVELNIKDIFFLISKLCSHVWKETLVEQEKIQFCSLITSMQASASIFV